MAFEDNDARLLIFINSTTGYSSDMSVIEMVFITAAQRCHAKRPYKCGGDTLALAPYPTTMICQLLSFVATCLLVKVADCAALEKTVALDNCLTNLGVPVFAADSKNFTQAVKPFNLRVPFRPAAYAVPETIKHVQDAVACGVRNNVRVTAKSGGHSYGSHGLGGEDGHIVVDMRRFNSVNVDVEAHTAVVGSGGRLGNIATALYNQGKQATSHGTCPGYVLTVSFTATLICDPD